jgi:hypothetical protein
VFRETRSTTSSAFADAKIHAAGLRVPEIDQSLKIYHFSFVNKLHMFHHSKKGKKAAE